MKLLFVKFIFGNLEKESRSRFYSIPALKLSDVLRNSSYQFRIRFAQFAHPAQKYLQEGQHG